MRRAILTLVVVAALAPFANAEDVTMLAWAPGYPGNTEQAQPSMDEFAGGVAKAAGWPDGVLRATYTNDVDPGRAAAADVSVVLVPLQVYLEYGEALGLRPLLRVVQEGWSEETWSLVAYKGAISTPSDLSGWRLEGVAGFSPRFVRSALSGWGALPADVEIGFNKRVLSVLRKAAKGEQVAALLDRDQQQALHRLPFAEDLDVVAQSQPMISSLLCAVGDRLSKEREEPLIKALLAMNDSGGDEALASIQVERFEPLDDEALAGVRRQWDDAAD